MNSLKTSKGVSGNGKVIPRGEGGRKLCSGRAFKVVFQGVSGSRVMLVIGTNGLGAGCDSLELGSRITHGGSGGEICNGGRELGDEVGGC